MERGRPKGGKNKKRTVYFFIESINGWIKAEIKLNCSPSNYENIIKIAL